MYAQLTVVTTSPSENYHDHSPSGQVSLNSDTSSKHENSMERARGVYSTALSHKIIDTREKKKSNSCSGEFHKHCKQVGMMVCWFLKNTG